MSGLARLIVCITVLFMLSACGLEETYILEQPIFVSNSDNSDIANNFYRLRTNESTNASLGDIFIGTVIYYKIYNSEKEMDSVISSISSSNSEYSQSGYNKLRSLDYKELLLDNTHGTVLIPQVNNNRLVEIRLNKEGSDANPFEKGLFIEKAFLGNPIRYNHKDFLDTDNFQGDDVVITSGISLDKWYINAYAISYGLDPYLSPIYSTLLHLGSVSVEDPD
ncbi:MAG: hypothetical protein ACRC4W_03810 [Treponemataceae bacterium]